MTPQQISAIRCAFFDLLGVVEAFDMDDLHAIDLDAVKKTINEFEDAFPDILEE